MHVTESKFDKYLDTPIQNGIVSISSSIESEILCLSSILVIFFIGSWTSNNYVANCVIVT